ncbi:MAG: hypothetical protein ABW088_05245 [Sedimenticola sp.]
MEYDKKVLVVKDHGTTEEVLLGDLFNLLPAENYGLPEYGDYPWDRWERLAEAAGVSKELANLGRSLMREANQHQWSRELKVVAGWVDGGEEMIKSALSRPEETKLYWAYLMDTDGGINELDELTFPLQLKP